MREFYFDGWVYKDNDDYLNDGGEGVGGHVQAENPDEAVEVARQAIISAKPNHSWIYDIRIYASKEDSFRSAPLAEWPLPIKPGTPTSW